MTQTILAAAVLVLAYFTYRFLYGTDTPHIKGLPEVPGLPLFGSLFELGTNHAKVAQGWAKKYGPVFQARLGNRVCFFFLLLFACIYVYMECMPIHIYMVYV